MYERVFVSSTTVRFNSLTMKAGMMGRTTKGKSLSRAPVVGELYRQWFHGDDTRVVPGSSAIASRKSNRSEFPFPRLPRSGEWRQIA